MILVADSGSTSTGWSLAGENGEREYFRTPGIHPYHQDAAGISLVLKDTLPSNLPLDRVVRVYFYGAGCWYTEQQEEVRKGLRPVFSAATIEVDSDLLGAARALFGSDSGLAVILGTGASAGMYDGKGIAGYAKALGYILGDPGSGAYLGRELLQHFLEESLPEELATEFQGIFNPDTQEILDRIYRSPYPNRYLASFVPFMVERRAHPFIQKMVKEGVERLVMRYIKRLPGHTDLPLGVVGSVAWHFRDLVMEILTVAGYRDASIISDPLPGLTEYHLDIRNSS